MPQIPNEFLFKVLSSLQAGRTEIKAALADHTRQLMRMRKQISALRGDHLRRENLRAQMETRLQRIENRLNLSDA